MPGRIYNGGNYRYGFNGKENDNEVKGNGNQQDYGFRIYDPRIVKFLSLDPITKEYPDLSPYQFAGNTPIQAVDIDGLEPASTIYNKDGFTPKTLMLASSTIQYKISDNAILKGGEIPKPKEFPSWVVQAAKDAMSKPQPASGALVSVYPEAMFLGGPAIKTGSKLLDLTYEVTIGSMGKPINGITTSLVKYDAKFAVRQGLDNGQFNFDNVRAMIPEGTPNTFIPTNTIKEGEKYLFEAGGSKVELKWHSPDANAAVKFPSSPAGKVNTAQVKVDNKLLNKSGNFQKKADETTHIPTK